MEEPANTQLIRLRPRDDVLYVSRNRTVLATDRDGFLRGGPDRGLFVHQTRLLSRYRYWIDGTELLPLTLSNVEQHSWLGYYIARSPNAGRDPRFATLGPGGIAAQETLELRLSRSVAGGIHEDVDLTNFTQEPVALTLRLDVDADFADKDETKTGRLQEGILERRWAKAGGEAWELVYEYRAEHRYNHQGNEGTAGLSRGIIIRVEHAGSLPTYGEGSMGFRIELGPRGSWHACMKLVPVIEGELLPAPAGCRSLAGVRGEYDESREVFLAEATAFASAESHTLAPVVIGALERAKRDLAALRLYDLDIGERAWTVAAGLPIYIALFGRDSLTAAWQAGLLGPELMRGTLPVLAKLQGHRFDDWRDEQPGKMLHQADTGPLATLNFNPLGRYYGSITTSGFYPVVVSQLWHWTGDEPSVRPFVGAALAALRWLDEHADPDGDGFYEYQTRSEQGLKNQAWKDSSDAIVHEDGSQVEAPIATCEEQGFVYLAKLHLSELLWCLDEKEEAKRLYREAEELKKRFNETFWMEEGFFALGLDAQKRPIRSIASNPGHCLATGIVDGTLARRTADRLMAEDLFSGWGVRTLSAAHPAYNPYSYHRGSVWPVEQATLALGFLRYGLHEHLEPICRAQFEAAAIFDAFRLPEVFSGHPRDAEHPFPLHYPGANSPQAWSASAVFCLLQAMLGLYPYAPLGALVLDPNLPDWLPEITLRQLRIGKAIATIRFFRKPDRTSSYEVLEKQGPLHIIRQPSPWSLTASSGERLKDAILSLLPR